MVQMVIVCTVHILYAKVRIRRLAHPWNGGRSLKGIMIVKYCACYIQTTTRDMRLKKEGQREGERWRKGVGSV